MRWRCLVPAGALVMLPAAEGWAQASGDYLMPKITVTGTSTGTTIAPDDTASTGTIIAPDLAEFPTYRVGETLEEVPGLIVTQHSGEGKANQYFLRGFNLDHGTDIDITLDDMPVNMRTHAHGQGYADLNFMIPELLSDIRYSKGPYFADQGDFATAGAVGIDYVNTLPHDLASVSAGTLGDYRGFAGASRPWGSGNVLVATEYDHVDGPWQLPDNYNKGNLVLRYSRGDSDNGLSLTGMYMNDAWHATNQVPERAVQSGLINLYGPLDPSDGGDAERISLSGKYAATTEAGQVKASAYFISNTLQLFNDFDGDVLFPAPIGDQFEQQERRRVLGSAVSDTSFGTLWGRPSANTVGFQTRSDDVQLGLAETTDRVVRFTVRDDHVTEVSGGLYGENRTQWLDKLRTVAGLRGDLYYGHDASTFPGDSGTAVKFLTSPKASTIFGPWRDTEFYLSYGQGFHSNDLRGAGSSTNALMTEITGTPVPQAKTPFLTKAEGYEAGLRSDILPKVNVAAALFVLDLASEATFDGDSAGTSAGRPSRRVGIELSGSYSPLPWLLLSGDFAFTRARFTDADDGLADVEPGHPGSYIPEAAKMIASAEAAVKNLGPWDGGLRFRYFGPRPLLEDATVRSGPTALVDARIGYALNGRWHAQLDLFNLFDSHAHQIDYYYPSQLPGEAAPVYDINFKPVEPLSARVTLSAKF